MPFVFKGSDKKVENNIQLSVKPNNSLIANNKSETIFPCFRGKTRPLTYIRFFFLFVYRSVYQ